MGTAAGRLLTPGRLPPPTGSAAGVAASTPSRRAAEVVRFRHISPKWRMLIRAVKDDPRGKRTEAASGSAGAGAGLEAAQCFRTFGGVIDDRRGVVGGRVRAQLPRPVHRLAGDPAQFGHELAHVIPAGA